MKKIPKFYLLKNFMFFFFPFSEKKTPSCKISPKKKNIVGGRDVGFGRKRNQAQANATTIVQLIKSKDIICINFHFNHIMLGLMVVEEDEHYFQLLLKRGKTCVKQMMNDDSQYYH
jgi:hypothetical protein